MEETILLLEKLRDDQTNAVNRQAFNMAIAVMRTHGSRTEGKWLPIRKGETGYSAGDFRCSVCGKANRSYVPSPNYCQECGADMRKRRQHERDNNTGLYRPKEGPDCR